jgi:ASC-1-like (ASCH) protein/N-acetylglutamate synthase-like GNAT family acetyltransferase
MLVISSSAQIMYVAEEKGVIIGLLNFVAKYQGTLKISPLIVHKDARGRGVSRLLLQKLGEYTAKFRIRQVYCTVSARNKVALGFFLAHGFVQAGTASKHYRADTDEVMLYKVTEHEAVFPTEQTISVLPLAEEDKAQVRELVISRLSPYFEGVNERWVDSLFAGYDRRHTRDPNEKYKLIWVAKGNDGTVHGIAAATPKKGEPVKLMPLVAGNIQAFSALVAELPGFLREYGHKLYTHTVPTSMEVQVLQHHGWQVEAMMPEAYMSGVVTQQWGLSLAETVMKTMRVKPQYFNAIMAGTKSLEVRVGYESIKKIRKGDNLRLECGQRSGIVHVADVRIYKTFDGMLMFEKAGEIVPDNPTHALDVLTRIYPPEKEGLGVYVLELRVVKRASDKR